MSSNSSTFGSSVRPAPVYQPTMWAGMTGQVASQVGVNGRVFITPVYLPSPATISKVGIFKAIAGGGGTNLRLGLYRDMGRTPEGGDLLFDSGNIAADAATGAVEADVDPALRLPAGYVWLALMTNDGTIQFGRYSNAPTFTEEGDEMLISCHFGQVFGAFTDPCPAVTSNAAAKLVGVVRVERW